MLKPDHIQQQKDEPDHILDVFLQPGDYYWGDYRTRIRALLGSCVAISLWHPEKLVGGMSHFLLPTRKDGSIRGDVPNGRFADEVMDFFLGEIEQMKTSPSEYNVQIFGGSSLVHRNAGGMNSSIGDANIKAARKLLEINNFNVEYEDSGSHIYRKVVFEIWSGKITVSRQTTGSIL